MEYSNLLTASQIADQLSEPPQRVAYIIRKYRADTRIFSPLIAFVSDCE